MENEDDEVSSLCLPPPQNQPSFSNDGGQSINSYSERESLIGINGHKESGKIGSCIKNSEGCIKIEFQKNLFTKTETELPYVPRSRSLKKSGLDEDQGVIFTYPFEDYDLENLGNKNSVEGSLQKRDNNSSCESFLDKKLQETSTERRFSGARRSLPKPHLNHNERRLHSVTRPSSLSHRGYECEPTLLKDFSSDKQSVCVSTESCSHSVTRPSSLSHRDMNVNLPW